MCLLTETGNWHFYKWYLEQLIENNKLKQNTYGEAEINQIHECSRTWAQSFLYNLLWLKYTSIEDHHLNMYKCLSRDSPFYFYIWLHNEDFFIPRVESAMNLPSLSLSPHSLFIFWFSWTKCRLSTSHRVTWKQIISQRIWCMQSTLIWARSSITGLSMLQGHRSSTLCIFSSSKRFGEFHNVPSPHHFCPSVFVCFSPRGLWSCF